LQSIGSNENSSIEDQNIARINVIFWFGKEIDKLKELLTFFLNDQVTRLPRILEYKSKKKSETSEIKFKKFLN
jgi:hypothetical protein